MIQKKNISSHDTFKGDWATNSDYYLCLDHSPLGPVAWLGRMSIDSPLMLGYWLALVFIYLLAYKTAVHPSPRIY